MFGPTHPKSSRDELFDRIFLEVSYIIGAENELEEKDSGIFVQSCLKSAVKLDEYPRKMIQITIMVIHDDGGALSCAINASILALIDAGLVMLRVPLSVTVFQDTNSNIVAIDPSKAEEESPFSSVMVLVCSLSETYAAPQIIATRLVGAKLESLQSLGDMIDMAQIGSAAVMAFHRKAASLNCPV